MKRGIAIAVLALAGAIGTLNAAAPRAGAVAQAGQITKVVSGSSVTTPGGSINYTITVSNPSAGTIHLECVTDTFPQFFTYHSGSTTGQASEPINAAYCVGWFFDGQTMGAGSSISWSFTADVSQDVSAGCYTNQAAAAFDEGVSDTGATAPVLVTASEGPCGQQTPPALVKSATPTFTATALATNTSVPTVAPPTATVVPPTATATPRGGGAAGAISAPNTGDGTASAQSGAASRSMLVLVALVAAGGLLITGAGIAKRRSR